MSWTSATFSNYASPYINTWSRAVTPNYYSYPSQPAQTSRPPSPPVPADSGTLVAVPPPSEPEPKKKRKKFTEDGRRLCLIVSIALLSSLIFIAIVALVILSVLLNTDITVPGQTSDDVVVGFTVTRTDLAFTNDLADAGSQAFKETEKVFCDMILIEWFQSKVSYDCQCVQFTSGSVSARMHLSANENTIFLMNLLSDLQTALPLMSAADSRVIPISRSDIQIVQ